MNQVLCIINTHIISWDPTESIYVEVPFGNCIYMYDYIYTYNIYIS